MELASYFPWRGINYYVLTGRSRGKTSPSSTAAHRPRPREPPSDQDS